MFDKLKEKLASSKFDLSKENTNTMTSAINEWLMMYKGQANWISSADGVYSCGIEQTLTRSIRNKILAEATIEVEGEGEKAEVLTEAISRLKKNLNKELELALAVGGFILKPYMDGEKIGIEFVLQGEFIPYGFDDDGNLIDVGFVSQIKKGNEVYTKIERHYIDNDIYTILTRAFNERGEVPLTTVSEWADITPIVRLMTSVSLFGYYRVPLANTVDINSPLGISIYEPSKTLIMLADKQLSRLDWEYNGGQLAVDVDELAVSGKNAKFNKLDECQQRLYRGIDLTDDKLYEVFAPSLRDANYRVGLNEYYKAIEDKTGVSRGTLSDVQEQPKTATEVVSSKQREYVTISENQAQLEECLYSLFDAMTVYANMLGLTGECKLKIDWGDSVLVDKAAELQEKITLMQNGILTEAEVRAFYLGIEVEEAEAQLGGDTLEGLLGEINDTEGTGEDNQPNIV